MGWPMILSGTTLSFRKYSYTHSQTSYVHLTTRGHGLLIKKEGFPNHIWAVILFDFVWFDSLRPINNLSVI